VAWSLLRFGATEESSLYGMAVIVSAAVGFASLSMLVDGSNRGSRVGLLAVGCALMVAMYLLPTFHAQGYTHLLVGWSAILVGLSVGRSSFRVASVLLLLVVVLGLAEVAYGLQQAFGIVDDVLGAPLRGGGSHASGTFINPNHFAGFVNLSLLVVVGVLPLVLGRSRLPLGGAMRGAAIVTVAAVVALAGAAVVLTRSRGGVLSLVGALLIAFSLLLWPHARKLRPLRLIADRPLGVGPGMWQWHFRRYQSVPGVSYYRHAHNDYLETAAEWGLPIALLLWAGVFWLFARGIRGFVASRDIATRSVLLATLTATSAILIHGMVDFCLQTPANLALFGFLLGLAWGVCERRDERRAVGSSRGGSPWAIPSAALSLCLLLLLGVTAASLVRREAAAEAASRAGGLAALESALGLDETRPDTNFYLGMTLRDGLERHDRARARVLLERAAALNPHAWRYRLELAWLDEMEGRLGDAEAGLEEAVRLNPPSSEYRWRLANLRARVHGIDAALDDLAAAVESDRGLAPAAVALATKSGIEWSRLRERWSDSPEALSGLLQVSCGRDGAEGPSDASLVELSHEVLDRTAHLGVAHGRFVVDCLSHRRLGEEARHATSLLASRNGLSDPDFESGNLLWNGSVELPVERRGLGWRRVSQSDLRVVPGPAPPGRDGTVLEVDLRGRAKLPELQRFALLPGPGTLGFSAWIYTDSAGGRSSLDLEVFSLLDRETLLRVPIDSSTSGWRRLEGSTDLVSAGGASVLRLVASGRGKPEAATMNLRLDDVSLRLTEP
jgi:tetratricopeptide (TPR) repeat protein